MENSVYFPDPKDNIALLFPFVLRSDPEHPLKVVPEEGISQIHKFMFFFRNGLLLVMMIPTIRYNVNFLICKIEVMFLVRACR